MPVYCSYVKVFLLAPRVCALSEAVTSVVAVGDSCIVLWLGCVVTTDNSTGIIFVCVVVGVACGSLDKTVLNGTGDVVFCCTCDGGCVAVDDAVRGLVSDEAACNDEALRACETTVVLNSNECRLQRTSKTVGKYFCTLWMRLGMQHTCS
jgi:hypothetical protein